MAEKMTIMVLKVYLQCPCCYKKIKKIFCKYPRETLSKSLNRGCATFLAGALGIGAQYLANICGDKGEPTVLGLMVFMLDGVLSWWFCCMMI